MNIARMFVVSVTVLILLCTSALADVTCTCQNVLQNGQSISGASCHLLSSSGAKLASSTTESSGIATVAYTLEEDVTYIVSASSTGFIDTEVTFNATSTDYSLTIGLSPVIEDSDSIRAVVQWGDINADMDSEVVILRSSDTFVDETLATCDTVNKARAYCVSNSINNLNISLAGDASSQWGSEATTFAQLPTGVYAFWVFNPENSWGVPPVTVSVYAQTGLVQKYSYGADAKVVSHSWHVFNVAVDTIGGCKTVTIEDVNAQLENGKNTNRYPVVGRTPVHNCTAISSCDTRITGSRRTCGVFGDPHVLNWSEEFSTCKSKGDIVVFSNEWLEIEATNVPVGNIVDGPTAVESLHLTYKKCNPMAWSVKMGQSLPTPTNHHDAGAHTIRLDGSSYFFDGINTRIEISQSRGYLAVAISTPLDNSTLATSYPPSDFIGLCGGCPVTSQGYLNISNPTVPSGTKRSTLAFTVEEAEEACQNANLDDYYYDSCVFDVVVTQSGDFIGGAVTAVDLIERSREPIPDPPASDAPIDEAPQSQVEPPQARAPVAEEHSPSLADIDSGCSLATSAGLIFVALAVLFVLL